MTTIPHVINHEQDVAVGQQFFQTIDGCIKRCETWSLVTEGYDQIFNSTSKIAGILAECYPEYAVVKCILDSFVVT